MVNLGWLALTGLMVAKEIRATKAGEDLLEAGGSMDCRETKDFRDCPASRGQ